MLLSGGIDSAVVGALVAEHSAVDALFVDYGQPSGEAEREASMSVAAVLDAAWHQHNAGSLYQQWGGELPGRNSLLISLAAALFPQSHIAIGIHAGTSYPDCSPSFAERWQALLDVESAGGRQLFCPLANLRKDQVVALARSLNVPLDLTHSCERSAQPCGACRSCLDRSLIDARS